MLLVDHSIECFLVGLDETKKVLRSKFIWKTAAEWIKVGLVTVYGMV